MDWQEIETRHRQIELAVKDALVISGPCLKEEFNEFALRIRRLRLEQENLEKVAADVPVSSDHDALCIAEIALRLCDRCDAEERDKYILSILIAGMRSRLSNAIAARRIYLIGDALGLSNFFGKPERKIGFNP
ncbi:MAG: hypothetical protein OEU92_30910 [Alphaproteobacteria bacterium]|nr:hypothetical protein [Alphaproteobacteria bacterium]